MITARDGIDFMDAVMVWMAILAVFSEHRNVQATFHPHSFPVTPYRRMCKETARQLQSHLILPKWIQMF